jgi:hypothetical protein
MKFNSRLNTAIVNLRNISASHTDDQLVEPTKFVCHIRYWFLQFVLPLYPKSSEYFLAIQFLLEIPEPEIPATIASCSRFVRLIEKFSYRDRNDFINSISYLINDLVIHRHPEWLDSCEGDYEYYYCATTDEIILLGEIRGTLKLNGQTWKGEAALIPATRSVLIKAGVLSQ